MAVSDISLKNLRPPVQVGERGRNPKGKPKGALNSKTIISKWLEASEKIKHPITGKEVNLTQLDIIALAQLTKARKGDTQAFNALIDRVEGKAKQDIILEGSLVVNWQEEKTYPENDRIDETDYQTDPGT